MLAGYHHSFLSSFHITLSFLLLFFLRFQYAGIYEVQKKRISHRFSHREKNPVTLLNAGSLTAVLFRRPDALRRLTASPGYVIPAARLQLLLSSITLIFFFLPLHFLLLTSSLFFFSFFLHIFICTFFFSFSFMRIFMCSYRLTSGAQQHQLLLTFPPCVCLLVHSFFPYFALYMLGCILFCSWIPLRAHSLFCFFLAFFVCIPLRVFLTSQSVYACRTLCIFFVYIFMCVFYC